MASYQAPGASLVALLREQLGRLDEGVLSAEARRCLVGYARHLERKGLSRDGDHLVAGLLLNAAEIACYLPAGKLGKGSVELTRLQERVERTLTAARRAEKRHRRGAEGEGDGGRRRVPLPGAPVRGGADDAPDVSAEGPGSDDEQDADPEAGETTDSD